MEIHPAQEPAPDWELSQAGRAAVWNQVPGRGPGGRMMNKIDPNAVPTQTFEWGAIKWLVSARNIAGAGLTFGEVVLLPGKGHARHNHPTSEEVLYVLSGHAVQMLNDEKPFSVGPGDTIYVPRGVFHSTVNVGWEPMRLIALYNPQGAEKALEGLPDFAEVPAGRAPSWSRAL